MFFSESFQHEFLLFRQTGASLAIALQVRQFGGHLRAARTFDDAGQATAHVRGDIAVATKGARLQFDDFQAVLVKYAGHGDSMSRGRGGLQWHRRRAGCDAYDSRLGCASDKWRNHFFSHFCKMGLRARPKACLPGEDAYSARSKNTVILSGAKDLAHEPDPSRRSG